MSDDATTSSQPGPHIDPERLQQDLAALSELVGTDIEIDGEAQVCESTWVVYGRSGYGGEVIVGEYQTEIEATEVLRASGPALGRKPDGEETVP